MKNVIDFNKFSKKMKKQLFLLIILGYISQGCENYILVRRTVTKAVTLTFNINNAGAFNSVSTISASDITNLFQGTIDPQQNTATQVTVRADVTSGAPTPLLNDTKLIRIGGNQLLQDVKDILNTTTGDIQKEVSFANALAALRAVGVVELQKIINENLQGVNTAPLKVTLSGSSPAGQRLVGQIVVTLNASITYSRCEKWTDLPIPMGFDEC